MDTESCNQEYALLYTDKAQMELAMLQRIDRAGLKEEALYLAWALGHTTDLVEAE